MHIFIDPQKHETSPGVLVLHWTAVRVILNVQWDLFVTSLGDATWGCNKQLTVNWARMRSASWNSRSSNPFFTHILNASSSILCFFFKRPSTDKIISLFARLSHPVCPAGVAACVDQSSQPTLHYDLGRLERQKLDKLRYFAFFIHRTEKYFLKKGEWLCRLVAVARFSRTLNFAVNRNRTDLVKMNFF